MIVRLEPSWRAEPNPTDVTKGASRRRGKVLEDQGGLRGRGKVFRKDGEEEAPAGGGSHQGDLDPHREEDCFTVPSGPYDRHSYTAALRVQ